MGWPRCPARAATQYARQPQPVWHVPRWIQTLRSTSSGPSPAAIEVHRDRHPLIRRMSSRHRAPEAVEPEGLDNLGTFAFEQDSPRASFHRRRQL
jgi:hypothetical protein